MVDTRGVGHVGCSKFGNTCNITDNGSGNTVGANYCIETVYYGYIYICIEKSRFIKSQLTQDLITFRQFESNFVTSIFVVGLLLQNRSFEQSIYIKCLIGLHFK